MGNTFDKIYNVVRQIPKGRVSTYGEVAALAGNHRWSRVVGYAMAACTESEIPCHRVVYQDGRLSPAFEIDGQNMQAFLLEEEGIDIGMDGKVDIKKFLWP